MGLLGLFKPRFFTSLPAPSDCRRLRLQFVEESLEHAGPQFAKLSQLQELYIQGDVSNLFLPDSQFSLPPEIGQLRTLQRLVLLNLPIDFPQWIVNLTNLRYLSVRGTDLTSIPSWISELKQLHTLRVENCDLAKLPSTLREMNNLRELGLVDTRMLDFSHEQIPQGLKLLDLVGLACMTLPKLTQIQVSLKGVRVQPRPELFR